MERVVPVLPQVIKSGQLCSVEEKNILFGIANIISSIDYINAHKVAAYLVSLDMYKAYDRVMLDSTLFILSLCYYNDQ